MHIKLLELVSRLVQMLAKDNLLITETLCHALVSSGLLSTESVCEEATSLGFGHSN